MQRARSFLLLLMVGCQSDCENAPDLERMIRQPRAEAFEATPFFEDGRTMRPLVEGTVPRSRLVENRELSHGTRDGEYVARMPIPVTQQLVERGKRRFEIHCAPCHGLLGDGRSSVADDMRLRKPPSLHDPRIREFTPGRLYAVILNGYGLMRSYAGELDIEDRWATVAYLRALQRSQSVPIDELPAELRQEASPWLK